MEKRNKKLSAFMSKVFDSIYRAQRLSDEELTKRVREQIAPYFSTDSEELTLLEELIERFEKRK